MTEQETHPAQPWRRRRGWWLALAALNLAGLLAGWWIHTLDDRLARQTVRLIGADRYLAGTVASLRVIVTDGGGPLAEARIDCRFARGGGYEGVTDASGTAEVTLAVPAETGPDTLHVTVRSPRGVTRLHRPVSIERRLRGLLSCDKPRYQPGQVVHLRGLLLEAGSGAAAAGAVARFEVHDPADNRLLYREQTAGRFGIVAAELPLADELEPGRYRLSLHQGERLLDERTVTVERYLLPKFAVTVTPAKPWYRPGEAFEARIEAAYFFGRPVAGGLVRASLAAFAAGREPIAKATATLDAAGRASIGCRLPELFVGQAAGKAMLEVTVTVIDGAGQAETVSQLVPVSAGDIELQAIAESGALVAGLTNRIYLLASRPDGTPVSIDWQLTSGSESLSGTTDEGGLAVVDLRVPEGGLAAPPSLRLGDAPAQPLELESETGGILLRPDRALYRVGETCQLTALTSRGVGSIYFDVVRDGQTLLTRAGQPINGQCGGVIELTAGMVGTLTLRAYVLGEDGEYRTDTRQIVVTETAELRVEMAADQPVYRPGETAELLFRVTRDGLPQVAALGVDIVDESVYALAERAPGLEAVRLLLERELAEPRVQTKDFSLYGALLHARRDGLSAPGQQALAAACLADLGELTGNRPGLEADSYRLSIGEVRRQQRAFDRWWRPILAVELLALTLGLSLWCGLRGTERVRRAAAWTWLALAVALLAAVPLGRGLAALPLAAAGIVGCARGAAERRARVVVSAALALAVGLALLVLLGGGVVRLPFRLLEAVGVVAVGATFGSGILLLVALAARRGGWRWVVGLLLLLGLGLWLLAQALTTKSADLAAPAGAEAWSAEPRSAVAVPPAEPAAPRLRQYFPETLLSLPEVVTDARGLARLEVPIADSITTWRVTACANATDGTLGSLSAPLPAFQPFFVELDLPVELTAGDRIELPVAIYNYTDEALSVALEFGPESDYFDLVSPLTRTVDLAPRQVTSVGCTVVAERVGVGTITVVARAGAVADAVRREVRIEPNGTWLTDAHNGRLIGAVEQVIEIPQETIPYTRRLELKLYPGIVGQLVDGLDSLLGEPYGCFEQTSSVTYPNILVLSHLNLRQAASPELRMRAESLVQQGYQRLLTFEVRGGGFDWFGRPPAKVILSAYGLLEFGDMAEVHPVDPAVLDRCRAWLLEQQQADGSWALDRPMHTWSGVDAALPVTAYVTWALALRGGEPAAAAARRGAAWLSGRVDQADDAYTLALCANALVTAEPAGAAARRAIERLAALARRDGAEAWWPALRQTLVYGDGDSAAVETTALATLALLRAQAAPELAEAGLAWLTSQRRESGGWGTTQATILALKALLEAARASQPAGNGVVEVSVNGEPAGSLTIDDESRYTLLRLDLTERLKRGASSVRLVPSGPIRPSYQLALRYALPWSAVAEPPEPPVAVTVEYDRTELQVHQTVTAKVTVTSRESASPPMLIVDLGLPPGFELQRADLDALVRNQRIERYQLAGRQLILYLSELPLSPSGEPRLELSYRLTPRYPVRAATPPSRVYEYYEPESSGEQRPQAIEVR